MRYITIAILIIIGHAEASSQIKTKVVSDSCIKPYHDYKYLTCNKIKFTVNKKEFFVPASFETDLASIPKIVWPIMGPAHSKLINPAIIHDWLYRKTCDFSRFQADLIFYSMLKSNGVSELRASIMYYAVRIFGWNYYNEDYCEEEYKDLDKEPRSSQISYLMQLEED